MKKVLLFLLVCFSYALEAQVYINPTNQIKKGSTTRAQILITDTLPTTSTANKGFFRYVNLSDEIQRVSSGQLAYYKDVASYSSDTSGNYGKYRNNLKDVASYASDTSGNYNKYRNNLKDVASYSSDTSGNYGKYRNNLKDVASYASDTSGNYNKYRNNLKDVASYSSDTASHIVVSKNYADNNYKYIVISDVNALMTYSGNATTVTVTDSLRGGVFNLKTLIGNSIDSGIVFPSAINGYVWKRDISNFSGKQIEWYGANYVADASYFFNKVLTLDSVIVLKSSKKYIVNSGINVGSTYLKIQGNGAFITTNTLGAFAIKKTNHNAKLEVDNANFIGVGNGIGFNESISSNQNDEFFLNNCTFQDSVAIRSVGAREGKITNCTFSNCKIAYDRTYSANTEVADCFFSNNDIAINDIGYGSANSAGLKLKGGTFIGNKKAIYSSSTDYVSIIDVMIDYNDTSVVLSGVDIARIVGGHISSRSNYPSVVLNRDIGTNEVARNITIIGASIQGYYAADSTFDAVWLQRCDNVSITGGNISFFTRYGIKEDSVSYLVVSNVVTVSPRTGFGLYSIFHNNNYQSSTCKFINNIVTKVNSTPAYQIICSNTGIGNLQNQYCDFSSLNGDYQIQFDSIGTKNGYGIGLMANRTMYGVIQSGGGATFGINLANTINAQGDLRAVSTFLVGDSTSLGLRCYNILPSYLANSTTSRIGETNSSLQTQAETNTQNVGSLAIIPRTNVSSNLDLYYSAGNGGKLGLRIGSISDFKSDVKLSGYSAGASTDSLITSAAGGILKRNSIKDYFKKSFVYANASSTTIATGTTTLLSFAAIKDSLSDWSTNTFTARASGIYNVMGTIASTMTWSGAGDVAFFAGGTCSAGVNSQLIGGATIPLISTAVNTVAGFNANIFMNAGETLKIYILQRSGGNMGITYGTANSFLSITQQ